MKRKLLLVLLVPSIGTVLLLSAPSRQLALHLMFGWVAYLRRVLPEVTLRWDGVAIFLVLIIIFTLFLHQIAAWLRREMAEQIAAWRWRSTLLVVGLLMIMFVAGIAMIGVTHQVAWFATDDAPLLVAALPQSSDASGSNLKYVALAMYTFEQASGQLPSQTPIAPEHAEHSWATHILPYLGLLSDIDLQKSWDHADNQPEIRKLVPVLLNPGFRPPVLRDGRGFGVSHYAGNAHLFDYPGRLSSSDISDGTANTLMIGEVHAQFQPWAKPRANRDPALGINRSPHGFGGPAANRGAHFSMADGSTRFFSSNTDPAVLQALATPAAEEVASEP